MIRELDCTIQPYAWGSRTALAELRGASVPSANPEAELWMGAHPLAPSRLLHGGQRLDSLIEGAPELHLGAAVSARFGARLPFLLKLLAAAEPLSLQAHPSASQAELGFEREEAAGIPLQAAHRSYKDRKHKPELLCALGSFSALCGFRDVKTTLELWTGLGVPELSPHLATLSRSPDASGISQVFTQLMHKGDASTQLATATARACQTRAAESQRFRQELAWGARLGELYPGDAGVVVALMLNLLELQDGEAVFLPAGNLHAYLGGTGVEVMAASDNVLRGGLTPKHIDVAELLKVVDFRPLPIAPLRPRQQGPEFVYDTPAAEFALSYFELDPNSTLDVAVSGPEIWVVLRGEAELSERESSQRLGPARSAFVSASTQQLRIHAANGAAARIFRARVAQLG